MESVSTQVNTLSIVNEDELDDEYDVSSLVNLQVNQYLSTSLIATKNINVSDVQLTVYKDSDVALYEKRL